MNLSKKCSDLSLSPLNIGGGTPDRDLLPLAVLFSAGGAGAVTVAAISVTIMAREYLFSFRSPSPQLLWTYPASPVRPRLRLVYLLCSYCIYRASFHGHRSQRLTYLMPRFTLIVCTIEP